MLLAHLGGGDGGLINGHNGPVGVGDQAVESLGRSGAGGHAGGKNLFSDHVSLYWVTPM